MMSLPFWALNLSVALLSMAGQKALRFHRNYLNLCSEDERRSYRFGTTWGWIINDNFHFGVNIQRTSRHRFGTNGRDWPDSWVTFGLLSCSSCPTLAPYNPVATVSNSTSRNLTWMIIFSDSLAEKSSTCFRVGQHRDVLYTPPPVLLSGASLPRKLVLGVTVGIRGMW